MAAAVYSYTNTFIALLIIIFMHPTDGLKVGDRKKIFTRSEWIDGAALDALVGRFPGVLQVLPRDVIGWGGVAIPSQNYQHIMPDFWHYITGD